MRARALIVAAAVALAGCGGPQPDLRTPERGKATDVTKWDTGQVTVTRFCDGTNLIYTSYNNSTGANGISVIPNGCAS